MTRMRVIACLLMTCLAAALMCGSAAAEDRVFSGPQVGERATPFKVAEVGNNAGGREWDVMERFQGKPLVIVFVHGIERSIVPLLTVVDEYAHAKRDALGAVFVALSGDRVESEKRLPLVAKSLRLHSPLVLSTDGAEGPGNYGLNRQCLMTVVVIAKDKKVTANFALVQPGIADGPAVIRAMAQACGDERPPTVEELGARRAGSRGDGGGREMARGGAQTRPSTAPTRPAADLPGAAPKDPKLLGLLRAFIRKDNDEATVGRLVGEVEKYVQGNPDLTRQAIDGWTRVLHLKYGTEYAQAQGRAMIERLRR
jgi:hypothetical protein